MPNKPPSSFHFCGFNGFGQFAGCAEQVAHKPTEFQIPSDSAFTATPIFSCTWSYTACAIGQELHLSGALCGHLNGHRIKLHFADSIRKLATTDRTCLVLLESGELHKVCCESGSVRELRFLGTESVADVKEEDVAAAAPARRKRMFPEDAVEADTGSSSDNIERITDIASTHTFSVALTSANALYCIPSRVHRFRRGERIVKLCAGAEHVLALSGNGDVYVFGSSLRGQLGQGQTTAEDQPVLLEALAGIKIVDIAAGSWHSAAVSAFGDLYTWGWNLDGQTGRAVYEKSVTKTGFDRKSKQPTSSQIRQHRRKLPTVFATADVIDLPKSGANGGSPDDLEDQLAVLRVWCGSRHTLIQTECGRWLTSGWNRYGQLGVEAATSNDDAGDVDVEAMDSESSADCFTEVANVPRGVQEAVCGSWCTIFVTR